MYRGRYTNDPYVIAKNNKMISVNTALQVDILGQVCSQSIGTRQFSGTGGQLDTHRGAQDVRRWARHHCPALDSEERQHFHNCSHPGPWGWCDCAQPGCGYDHHRIWRGGIARPVSSGPDGSVDQGGPSQFPGLDP